MMLMIMMMMVMTRTKTKRTKNTTTNATMPKTTKTTTIQTMTTKTYKKNIGGGCNFGFVRVSMLQFAHFGGMNFFPVRGMFGSCVQCFLSCHITGSPASCRTKKPVYSLL